MAQPHDRIEDLQASRAAISQQAHREAIVRQALARLAPQDDDALQGYTEVLRRLKTVIETELAKVG